MIEERTNIWTIFSSSNIHTNIGLSSYTWKWYEHQTILMVINHSVNADQFVEQRYRGISTAIEYCTSGRAGPEVFPAFDYSRPTDWRYATYNELYNVCLDHASNMCTSYLSSDRLSIVGFHQRGKSRSFHLQPILVRQRSMRWNRW